MHNAISLNANRWNGCGWIKEKERKTLKHGTTAAKENLIASTPANLPDNSLPLQSLSSSGKFSSGAMELGVVYYVDLNVNKSRRRVEVKMLA